MFVIQTQKAKLDELKVGGRSSAARGGKKEEGGGSSEEEGEERGSGIIPSYKSDRSIVSNLIRSFVMVKEANLQANFSSRIKYNLKTEFFLR